MEKSLFERIGGTYHQAGDYLIPNLVPPKVTPIGIWDQRRRQYLRKHRDPLYTALFLRGELDAHLAEINRQAEEIFFQIVKQMAKQEGITEQLKAEEQITWAERMNNIRNRAEDIVMSNLIFN